MCMLTRNIYSYPKVILENLFEQFSAIPRNLAKQENEHIGQQPTFTIEANLVSKIKTKEPFTATLEPYFFEHTSFIVSSKDLAWHQAMKIEFDPLLHNENWKFVP